MTAEDEHIALAFPQKPVRILSGAGARLKDDQGRTFVDLGGASHGVANFGHSHPRIVAAIQEAASRLVHVVPTLRSPEREAFLERLHQLLPAHLARTFLANSGAEAVEAALKYAMASTGRTRIVAARGAFHGRTLGALAVTHRPSYRKPFEAALAPVHFIPFDDAAALAEAVDGQTAAIILEPVQGEGGVTPATDEYLQAARRVANENGALLILDEVQTGLGRTGADLAHTASGVVPDVLTLGKSLAGGLPIGTVSMRQEVASAMPSGAHGGTFGGSPVVMAAAAAALDVLREERLSTRSAELGAHAMERLGRIADPSVRAVRGRGLMIGLDLRHRVQPLLNALMDSGFLALPAGPTVLRLLPPLVIDEDDMDLALRRIEDALPRVRETAVEARTE